MVGQRPSATTALVESSAPDWAQRLGLRLPKTFQGLYPLQPTHLWDAGAVGSLPPAADWPGSVAVAGGVVWVSNGAAWVAVGPAAPQTDAVTPPQFDHDTSIATTAFVQRALGNYPSAGYTAAALLNLTMAQAGSYFLLATAGAVVNLPVPTGQPSGVSFAFQAGAGAVTINAPAGGVLYHPTLFGLSTFNLPAGKSVSTTFDSGAAWFLSGTGV